MVEMFFVSALDVMSLEVILHITLGVFIGYMTGVLPGMNRATVIAVALPFTFAMSPLVAISMLMGINKGGASGSAVTAILINVPGEPSSVMTAMDGYPLANQGKSRKALKLALFASVIGDILATLALIAIAPPLARMALAIGPVELTAILLFAITFIAAVSGRSFVKGLIAGFLGLLLATPGLDIETGQPRLTFGIINLFDGVPLLAVAIGTLALSEVLSQIDHAWRGKYTHRTKDGVSADPADGRLSMAEFRQVLPTILRSSGIGTLLGIIPGLGASVSSFLAYTVAKQRSKTPEKFGKGALEGVAASEAADNANVPASLISVFAIGVPGSISAALLMAAFMLHDVTPGPLIFRDEPRLIFAIYNGMIIASVVMLMIGLVGERFFSALAKLPDTLILPPIVLFCVVGAYVEGGSMFSVYLMIGFAVIGYVMRKFDYSFVTFLIGFVLGPMMELSLRQSMVITRGDFTVLKSHPLAVAFLLFAVVAAIRFTMKNFSARK